MALLSSRMYCLRLCFMCHAASKISHMVAAVWTLYNISAFLSSLAFNSILSFNSEENMRGKISGRLLAGSSLGDFIGAVISGIVFQYLSFTTPFYLSALCFTASLFAMKAVVKSNGIYLAYPGKV